ncbi:MAG TPA: hypothetical protein VFG10_07235 [Saprospiraceae bacterium]|nr:hypothetical protein [Saprospiraceae bacterium]
MDSGTLIKNILIDPRWATVCILILWLVIYYTFSYIIKISEVNWKRLEYIWIFIGSIGLFALINQNKIDNINGERRFNRMWIDKEISRIKDKFIGSQTCFIFITSKNSPNNLTDLQFDQDLICNWSKNYSLDVYNTSNEPEVLLDTISILSLPYRTNDQQKYIDEFLNITRRINNNINSYKIHVKAISSNKFDSLNRSFGILLFIVAISIRLAIVCHSVSQLKKIKNN